MSRCRQAVSIPIDHVGDGCMPTVTEDKAVDQVVGVGCISNCTLEMAVDGPAGDVIPGQPITYPNLERVYPI